MSEPAMSPPTPDVLAETFDGETVIVHLGTGCYYALDDAGRAVWELVCPGRTRTETIRLAAELHGLAAADVATFIDQLVDEQLLAEGNARANGAIPAPRPLTGAPSFERFADMQELLVVDPVHDIALDGDGWPVVKPAAG